MLEFKVNGQTLTRLDTFNAVTDSAEYLKATFTFTSSDWTDKVKTVLFRLKDNTYSVLLVDGVCTVPAEVLAKITPNSIFIDSQEVYISVFGVRDTVRITTNEVKIPVRHSGYIDGETPSEPTPSIYDQILTKYNGLSSDLETHNRSTADGIVCESSGSVVSVNDASDKPLQNLIVYGKSVQDGTPTPDNPVEIVSVESPEVIINSGNLINARGFDLYFNDTFVSSEDGYVITASGGTTKAYTSSTLIFEGTSLNRLRGKKVYFKADEITNTVDNSKGTAQINMLLPSDKLYMSLLNNELYMELTIPEDILTLTIGIYTNNTSTALDSVNTVVVKGLSLSLVNEDWVPYKEPQYLSLPYTLRGIPVASGGNYTDENGQSWICDEINLNRGLFIKRIELTSELSVIDSPIETALTDEQINAFKTLRSYKPNTTIFTDDIGEIDVEYVADTKVYIDNKIKELGVL